MYTFTCTMRRGKNFVKLISVLKKNDRYLFKCFNFAKNSLRSVRRPRGKVCGLFSRTQTTRREVKNLHAAGKTHRRFSRRPRGQRGMGVETETPASGRGKSNRGGRKRGWEGERNSCGALGVKAPPTPNPQPLKTHPNPPILTRFYCSSTKRESFPREKLPRAPNVNDPAEPTTRKHTNSSNMSTFKNINKRIEFEQKILTSRFRSTNYNISYHFVRSYLQYCKQCPVMTQ